MILVQRGHRFSEPTRGIFLELSIKGEYIELNGLLKLAGVVGSGGEGKLLVADGKVYVDGQKELRRGRKIRPGSVVRIGSTEIRVVAE